MTCYLSNRSQVVQVGDAQSAAQLVETGFPQGSVLGGPNYTMHSSPLDEVLTLHSVENQSYADDTNLYLSFDLRDASSTAGAWSKMEHCLSDVNAWMVENKLQLNCSKTVVVLFKPKYRKLNFIIQSRRLFRI